MKRLLCCFLLLLTSTTFANLPCKQLSGQQIKTLLTGKMVLLTNISKYNVGDIFTPQNWIIAAFYKNNIQKGVLAYAPKGGQRMDSGRWWLKGNLMCAHWNHWEKGQSFCIHWCELQDHYFLFDEQHKLHGIVYKKNIR